ncbi:ankyrin repeat-containing protein At5g02620 isoform X2 [Eucalyptus grandis]|uniref:ankyrin repeat-containing protein At5g02620 isoform X2 n=1 Tax=Eucalyptus grandis TaxID=71139 RepID=UPI00192EE552|nr:ankyrin repeat-containing protein At5g02620 isoform X2 [Eucalyptus grandis]
MRMHHRLYEAAKSGDFDCLKIISEDEEDLFHRTTPKDNSILHVAAQYKQENFIQRLLRCPSGPSLLWQVNCKGDTPLHVAAKVGSYEVVRVFIDLAKSLHWVVEEGRVEACKELLRKSNLHKDTALHYAVRGGHRWVVKLLIEEDPQLCSITNVANESPLYLAANRGLSHTTELILDAFSSSSSHKGPKGLTALHTALYGSLTSWWKIVEKRPEVIREGDDMGWTPLHYVSCIGKVKEVRLLLQQDISVAYDLDKEGQSALHIAAFQGHVDVIDELVRSCPDACDIINTKGQTALHAAVIGGQVNAVKYILGTPNLEDLVNEQDISGNTALHLAALHKHYNIIYILGQDKRVDLLATNKDHMTALDIFSAHKEGGYQAAKVYHVLKGSHGMPFYQDWVIEYVKKRLDKQNVEGQPAASIITGSNIANPENIDSSKRSIIDLQLLVAVLIATVSFAASFTMPGGYNQDGPDQGMAILAGRAAFKAFVISNTTAFGFSILALFLQFDTCFVSDRLRVRYAKVASYSMYVAILAMVLAFATGTYVVLSKNTGLRIVPFVVSGCLVTMYVIGGFLDPEAPFWWLSSTPRRYVRNLLFDYGVL